MRSFLLKRSIFAVIAAAIAITASPVGRVVAPALAAEASLVDCDEGDCGCPQPKQMDDCRAAARCLLTCAAAPGVPLAVPVPTNIGIVADTVGPTGTMSSRAIPPPTPPPLA